MFPLNEKYQNLAEYKKQIAEGKSIELTIDNKKEERANLKDQQFEIIKSNIYSSYKIPTNENKQLFTNTDTNGKDEMGNIEEMYHQLMNKTI